MKTTRIALLIGIWALAACGTSIGMEEQLTNTAVEATHAAGVSPAIAGHAGDMEFVLDEDVFTVERNRFPFLIALVLYLPFLLI
ncbi:hypothetical protein C7455_101305 [Roseicyclus mahoneyensis]|uniref:Lipoprotein n=1 Tax=Roseicyclus mahoneyensis TaxID=164332 RepID=A0A316GNA6_9RHOB|nr:hypothetical protein C7455_101305 [Roseicyclus mahoneyensis]